jgi:predicted Holliday junction resolvase-like endonuclease
MKPDFIKFFTMQRQIFGICPECNEFFRLSECRVFLKRKPRTDWLEKLTLSESRLQDAEERLSEAEEDLREKARRKGRKLAQLAVTRIDPVFSPRKLNPDDAKVMFHPVDYIVFDGMKTPEPIKRIILLDRKTNQPSRLAIQKSIERTVERGNYDWQTLRVHASGTIEVE